MQRSQTRPGAHVRLGTRVLAAACGALRGTEPAALVVSPTDGDRTGRRSGHGHDQQASGEIQAESKNTAIVTVTLSNRTTTGATLTLHGKSAGTATVYVRDTRTANVSLPVSVVRSTSGSTARYTLIAWNDLGMHCMDGIDYSVFSILPPYNNLNAQLVNASTGKAVTSGVTLTYESVADASGSINTSSAGKTNFWSLGAHDLRCLAGRQRRTDRQHDAYPHPARDDLQCHPRLVRGHRPADHALRRPG